MRVTATARFATWNSLRWWAADGEERRAGAAVHHLEAQQAPPKFQRPQDVRQLEVDWPMHVSGWMVLMGASCGDGATRAHHGCG
jgi:hypothetical protein